MKRYFYYILILCCVIVVSCQDKVEFLTLDTFTEKYPFNVVGLLGEASDTAYVEVWYSEANGSSNQLVHRWVKPPVIIGGHYTNVLFDSTGKHTTKGFRKPYNTPLGRKANVDYSVNGSHYMKIVNHGSKPLEYFIAGGHNMKTYIDRGVTITDVLPEVSYQNAPILYLLFPEKKPNNDRYKVHYDKYNQKSGFDTVYFSNNRCGNLVLNQPWNIEQVMKLYRAEYRTSNDTILTISYVPRSKNPEYARIISGYVKLNITFIKADSIQSISTQNSVLKHVYYGHINPDNALQSNDEVPFITHLCYEYYRDEDIIPKWKP